MYVSSIDWSDEMINRAGVIPYYINKNRVFLGLGINQNNTTITTIGGTYESRDFDLLDTAIREYNEEVGENMPNICFEDVVDCMAVKSKRSIHIFLQVNNIPENFKQTNEFVTLLWVTPHQLKIMNDNPKASLNHKNTRAFPFAVALKECVDQIINHFNNIFETNCIRSNKFFERKKKIIEISKNISIGDLNKLKSDISLESKIYHFGLVITETKFGVIVNDSRIYLIDNSNLEDSINTINKVNVFKCLARNSDVLFLKNRFGFKIEKLHSLERCMIKNTDGNDDAKILCMGLRTEFLSKLELIRNSKDDQDIKIIEELNIINEYERKSYNLHSDLGLKYMANTRLKFFEKINLINNKINTYENFHIHHMKDWEYTIFIYTNFYKYSREKSIIYL